MDSITIILAIAAAFMFKYAYKSVAGSPPVDIPETEDIAPLEISDVNAINLLDDPMARQMRQKGAFLVRD